MARKLVRRLLLGLTILALLPGCQSLFHSSPVAADESKKGYEVPLQAAPPDLHSTAVSREVKSPTPKEQEIVVPPGALPPSPPRSVGTPGSVVVEKEPLSPSPPQLIATQPALPNVEEPHKLAPAVQALHMRWTANTPKPLEHLKAYDSDTQEVMIRLFPLLTSVIKSPIEKLSSQDIQLMYETLCALGVRIRPRTELIISKMCYCREISGYGAYEALPDNHAFLAPTPDRPGERVLLYVELKNFMSEQLAKGDDYQTKLTCSLQVIDARGEKVWSYTYPRNETTQRRRTRLNDLYSNYSFYVPTLPPGTYQLAIQIVDETLPDWRRVAHEKLVFRVTPVVNP